MWPFKNHAPQPPRDWAGPVAFFDWTDEDIDRISAAIRKKNGQPDSEGFRRDARIALNVLRGGSAVELVARAIEQCSNGGDGDRPIEGNHYMHGMPRWCMWVEYARPAVEAICGKR